MSVALSAIFIQYIYIYFRNCLDSEIRRQQSCFLLFYLRKCAVNEEHHNTVVQTEKKQEAQQKVEAHKEPIAEDFENSCSLLYIYIYMQHNYLVKLSDPQSTSRRPVALINWQMEYLGDCNYHLSLWVSYLCKCISEMSKFILLYLNENWTHELFLKFILQDDLNIYLKRTKDIMKWCKHI